MQEIDLKLLSPVLAQYGAQGRTALLPALHAAQEIYGWLPEPVAAEIGRALGVALADVYGVIDFYTLFYPGPVGDSVIHVCGDPACAMAGSDAVMKMLARRFDMDSGLIGGPLRKVTLENSPCLGLCEHAPAVTISGRPVAPASPDSYEGLFGSAARPRSLVYREAGLLTANCGRGQTTTLGEYTASGGYQGLRRALELTPEAVIDEVKRSGLAGRGGAAFPAGLKWEAARAAPGETRYVVCNADEAEPGTFKDRVLLEDDPHLPLEGLIIAAYAIGAPKGYIYIRGEYLYQFTAMEKAVEEARAAGFLGRGILGTSFDFDVELRRGAGAYVCGEETALFESIEGKRGFPRMKPPFPTTRGLFGQPTVINNVETLANIPFILRAGAARYREIGTEKSPGTKLFCLSGDVARPGLYEIPFGVTFRRLLELAGGVRGGRAMQAALIGGAAGAFASPADLDVRLTFEDLRAAGLPLGSGVITVFDQTRDLRDVLFRLARFFADEACGKCFPCQIGTQRQLEILRRVSQGRALPGDADRLRDTGLTMADASLCGLGQTAASAVLSALRLRPDLFSPGSRND